MALPTLEKTWKFNVSRPDLMESVAVKHKDALLWMKNNLIGRADAPWSVNYSCNSVDVGTPGDGVDRWLDYDDIVEAFPPGAHSWMVLDTPLGSSQLCIDYDSGSNWWILDMVFSPEGLFTGGTAGNRPTAVDEAVDGDFQWLDNDSGLGSRCLMSLLHTTDGSMNMWLTTRDGKVVGGWLLFEALNPESGWTMPYGFWRIGANRSYTAWGYDNFLNNTRATGGAKKEATGDAGVTFEVKFAGEGIRPGTGSALPLGGQGFGRNSISGKYELATIWVMSETSGAKGLKGRIPDLYFVSTKLPEGASLEDDPFNPEFKWIVLGNIALPWDGSLPVMS